MMVIQMKRKGGGFDKIISYIKVKQALSEKSQQCVRNANNGRNGGERGEEQVQ
jgi:hypothetical protein